MFLFQLLCQKLVFCKISDTQTNVYAQSQSLGAVGPAPEQSSNPIRIKEECTQMSVVSQPQAGPATLIITTPVAMNPSQSSISDPVICF